MNKIKIKEIVRGFKKNGVNYPEARLVKIVLLKTKEKSKQSK